MFVDVNHNGIPAMFMKNVVGALGPVGGTFPGDMQILPLHMEKKNNSSEQLTIILAITNDACPRNPWWWVVLDHTNEEIALVKSCNFR